MKATCLAPIALGALLTTPSILAQDASPASPPSGDVTQIHIGIAASFDRLDDLVEFGLPTQPEIDELARLLEQLPTTSALRARIHAHLDDFAARTRRAFVTYRDVADMRIEYVLGQIEDAVSRLESRARGGNWSADDFADVVEAWTHRARLFAAAPTPADFRARFTAAVRRATDNARTWAEARRRLAMIIAVERARRARAILSIRVSDGSVEPYDYRRLASALKDVRALRVDGAPAYPLD